MLNKFLLFLLVATINSSWGATSLLQCAPEELFSSSAANECEPLGIGKSRRIRGYNASSGISVKDHYMQRTEADKYQVFLNINFILGDTGKTSPADMMKKVKGCLEIATPNLRGPDGSTLQINAITPDEAEALPKKLDPVDIKIESGMRAHAEMYTDELNCGEITHEILHLLGLCDEYKEPSIVAGNTYACRVVPEVSTIMKNPRAVYARASPRELACKCDENCQTILGFSDENLKKIYVAPNIYDAVDVNFRTNFCKPPQVSSGLVEAKDLANPDRAMSLLSSDETSFVVQNREVSPAAKKVYLSSMSCSCQVDDAACMNQRKVVLAAISSPDSVRTTCPSYTGVENYSVKVEKDGYRLENGSLILSKKGTGESFLYPNHWARIMAGSCSSLVSSYNECATPAYRSLDCQDFKQCTDEYFLGTQK